MNARWKSTASRVDFFRYLHTYYVYLSFRWDMNKQKRYRAFRISWIALLLASSLCYHAYAVQGTISLEIIGKGIRHGTPDSVNLWVLSTSTGDQEISGQFTGYFRVEDLEWYTTGHYTTIQCDGVHGPSGYTLTWVYLKAENITPTLIQGATGNVHIASWFSNFTSILNPMTYIYKPTAAGNLWYTNRYGDKPRLKILIPGYAPPGTYSGTIVFSFYMY